MVQETAAGTIDVDSLDPDDPKVYANPDLLRMLPPTQQMIGIINLAQSGQIVAGDQTMTLEAILAGAGYQVSIDGQLSAEEMAALQNFEDKLNDKQFNEAGKELIGMILGTDESGKPLFPVFSPASAIADAVAPDLNPAQTAAFKVMKKVMGFDPD